MDQKSGKITYVTISLVVAICLLLIYLCIGLGPLEKIRIDRLINNYFEALSLGQFERARGYCISDSMYYKYVGIVKQSTGLFFEKSFTFYISKWIWLKPDSAFIDIEIIRFPGDYQKSIMFLEKTGLFGSWKIK